MKLEYVPLLRIQRELQGIPRGSARFRQYLRTILNDDGTGLELPSLGNMNPMGREHVTELLDALIALDADRIAADAVAEASRSVEREHGDFKIALVVADDLKGGWTNRFDYEYNLRFPAGSKIPDARILPRWLKYFWLTGVLWSSDCASQRSVREAILTTVFRAAHIQVHGIAGNLREMLAQEGAVLAQAGCTGPTLDEDGIAYTRAVLGPFLDAADKRTVIECLFGDSAGQTLGLTPRGLSPWAGLALALHDARPITSLKSATPI